MTDHRYYRINKHPITCNCVDCVDKQSKKLKPRWRSSNTGLIVTRRFEKSTLGQKLVGMIRKLFNRKF